MHDSHEEVQGATRLNSGRGPAKEHRSVQAEVGLRVAFWPFAASFQVQKGYRKSFQVLAMSGLETVAQGIQHRRARGATVVCHDDSTTKNIREIREIGSKGFKRSLGLGGVGTLTLSMAGIACPDADSPSVEASDAATN